MPIRNSTTADQRELYFPAYNYILLLKHHHALTTLISSDRYMPHESTINATDSLDHDIINCLMICSQQYTAKNTNHFWCYICTFQIKTVLVHFRESKSMQIMVGNFAPLACNSSINSTDGDSLISSTFFLYATPKTNTLLP